MRLIAPFLLMLMSLGLAQAADVRVYVFDGDEGHRPLPGISVSVNDVSVGTTNADGRVVMTQAPGQISIELKSSTRSAQLDAVPVIEGETTEVMVTLYLRLTPRIHIEHRPQAAASDVAVEDTAGTPGTVTGRCVDEENAPISGAQVFVRGRSETVTTDRNGHFSLLLPAGDHALSMIRTGHRNGRVEKVTITAEQSIKVPDVVMPKSNPALEDFVVSAPYLEGGVAALVSERRETSSVVDVIGAEQMSQNGDSSAAGALKRVTGLTIVGGKYIYVRGMGERYSSTTLNGMFLPSPEPERRVVPLDMFPTGILSSVVVQKTYSSDQSAEFGGGVVQLRTRRLPEKPFFEASVSTGGRVGTTFARGLTYEGGDHDWLGFDSGARALPSSVKQATDDTALRLCSIALREGCLAPDDLTALGQAFPATYDASSMDVPLDVGASLSGGYVTRLNGIKFGGVTSVQYDQGWEKDVRTRNTFRISAGNLERSDGGEVERLVRTVQLSGILELGLDIDTSHQLATTTLFLRNTDDETSQFIGTNIDERSDVRVTRLRWVERELLTQQLRGQHELDAFRLKWHYGYSLADRLEPNRRISQYDRSIGIDDPFGLSAKPEGNRRFYSDLDDTTHDAATSLRYTFVEAGEGRAATFVEAGGALLTRERSVETRRYKFQGPAGQPESLDTLFAVENIGTEPGQYRLLNTTQVTDDYGAEQSITAAYLSSEVGLLGAFRLMAGARFEQTVQEVETFSPFTGDDAVKASLKNQDILPSASATWVVSKSMQVRAGYGRTVSRPEFRELSPARFDDVTNRRSVVGNPELERGLIDHYDLRWEWYFSAQDSLSVAGFYKDFTDPIETKISCGADKTLTFRNSPTARNVGAEFAVRKDLDFVGLPEAYASGNVSLIQSDVDLGTSDGCETSSERPLEGQSPYVANVQLGYDSEPLGLNLALLYNVFGKRIVEVGTSSLPDVYEQPRHLLDFVVGVKLGAGFALKFKAKNLIDLPVDRKAGDLIQSRYVAGRSFGLGLKYAPSLD